MRRLPTPSPRPRVDCIATLISLPFPKYSCHLALPDAHYGLRADPRCRLRTRLPSLLRPSPVVTTKGKPRAARKTATPTKKKELTHEQRAKRKEQRHAHERKLEDESVTALTTAAQPEEIIARIVAALREALIYVGLNLGQHGLATAASVVVDSTSSSAFPRVPLQDSPRTSTMPLILGFHTYPQASCLCGECLPKVSVVAPAMPVPMAIDLNIANVAGGSSSGGERKHPWESLADMLPGGRYLFNRMPATDDETVKHFIIENTGFKVGTGIAAFDPEETQIQDGPAPFMADTMGHGGTIDPFMQGQDDMSNTFPIDHEFLEDYGL
ncbi:DNA repair protein rhp54 [Hordeum vulgare]|nr:DNA repair protein rhp54 [Hordeum vulgare]